MPRRKKGSDFEFKMPKLKSKGSSKVLLTGICLSVLIVGVVAFRFLGAPFPFIFSNAKPAPEGVAITISLLAFCKDNTTEIISTKEFKLSEMQLLSPAGKEVKYLAVTAMFLTGPPKGEQLQTVTLTYTIQLATDRGLSSVPLSKVILVPVVYGLALHQAEAVSITPEELGLTKVGDMASLRIDVKVQADMQTDTAHWVMSSNGYAQAQVTLQEGNYIRLSGTEGQVSEGGHGYVAAVLTGSWAKPTWRTFGVLELVDPSSGEHKYTWTDNTGNTPEPTPEPTPPPPTPPPPTPPPPTIPPTYYDPTEERENVPPPDEPDEPDSAGACFLSETLVLTSEGERKISDVSVGEKVLGVADMDIAEGTVTQVLRHMADAYYVIGTANRAVRVTGEHRFLTGNGWKAVRNLALGDCVIILQDGHLCEEEVLSKRLVSEQVAVFNIKVSETGTYFAGGFAVHNAKEMAWISDLANQVGLGWLFRPDRLLLPVQLFGVTVDFTLILVAIGTIVLIAVGLALRKGKR